MSRDYLSLYIWQGDKGAVMAVGKDIESARRAAKFIDQSVLTKEPIYVVENPRIVDANGRIIQSDIRGMTP